MQGCIYENDLLLAILKKNWLIGDHQKRESLSFAKMLKRCLRIHPCENFRALIAASLLEQDIIQRNIAQMNAWKKEAWRKEQKNVSYVENYSISKSTHTKKYKPVVISVDGNSEEEIVFNLTVEQAHCYYANGVLVSNSDSEDHCADSLRLKCLQTLHGPVTRAVNF
jgi:hypothetical protein